MDIWDLIIGFGRRRERVGRAWVYGDIENAAPSAICIYAIQENESINDARETLPGKALKLCTFKVADLVRGRKIGELFLKGGIPTCKSQYV